ncbi:hypothetical protein [Caballeronia grimmiae]|uniref:hypothetical protein n=1 Tax=Caballeronia grimmiae TaxID=1071679 RepID=UPI0013642C83
MASVPLGFQSDERGLSTGMMPTPLPANAPRSAIASVVDMPASAVSQRYIVTPRSFRMASCCSAVIVL